jgi:Uncharacterised nucleotidyltransferase
MRWRRRRDPIDALLQAAVSEPGVAREAWGRWIAGRSLEDVSWEELRLLGAVAGRADLLGVTPAQRPRLDGIRRFIWTFTQMKLAAALPVLRQLAGTGVPVCLLKGAGLIAGGHLAAGERFIRDVDVLVPRSRIAEAVAILLAAGWKAERYDSPEQVFSLGFPRCHALAFRSEGHPDDAIDLHLSASELGRFPKSDDGLWSRARQTRLFGLTVRVPAPEDLLCNALAHSYLSDRSEEHDWAVDAVALARLPGFDWSILARESHRRGVDALVGARLKALGTMRAPTPHARALRELDGFGADADLRRELRLLARRRPSRSRAGRRVRSAARAVRARRQLALGNAAPVDEKPPFPAACAWLRLDAPLPVGFPSSGRPRSIELRGRILNARPRSPIPYHLYCGSVRLAEGRTRVASSPEGGGVHRIRVTARLDPVIAAAEGRPPLSLYFGRRSRATSPLGPDALPGIDLVR